MSKALNRQCLRCNSQFEVSELEQVFLSRAAPRVGDEVLTYSLPRFCPSCRDQGRLAWRNDRSLYTRSCGLCKKRVVSCYSPASEITVYCNDCFNGDAWNPLEYGREYDPSKPFLEQFSELFRSIPHLALYNLYQENSEYCNHAAHMKDSYLVFASAWNERTLYATRTVKNLHCVDLVESGNCEASYSLLDCDRCYEVYASSHCTGCSNSALLFDCHSCRDCFGSVNLRSAQYVFFNEQLSKEDYKAKIEELALSSYQSWQKLQQRFAEHLAEQPKRAAFIVACEDCTGDQLLRCKGSTNCFNLSEAEDCHYCELGIGPKDSYDASGISYGELCYGIVNHVSSSRTASAVVTYYDNECYYTYHTQSGMYLLGCVGLRQQKYCVLNKQCSKEEFEAILKQVANQLQEQGVWGEFYPGTLSPFGYNETEAQSIYSLDKTDAVKQGFNWSEHEPPAPEAKRTVDAAELADRIEDVGDEILEAAILSLESKRLFKIMPTELDFYRKHGLPLPRLHPDERYRQLLARRNPRRIYTRTCSKCESSIQTTYAPSREEALLCQACYNKATM